MRTVTIIICTRDRADTLSQTLVSLGSLSVPTGVSAELIIVDNGSFDATPRVVTNAELANLTLRYVREDRPGKCAGLNRAVAQSTGEILLFTDDDVRPPVDWISRMCQAIWEGRADAVAGGVKVARHLERPWLTGFLREMVASTESWRTDVAPQRMIGANMAVARYIFDLTDGFDTELGPGALGFGEESLLSAQILRRGLRIVGALDVCVEHHFDPGRLTADGFDRIADAMGRSNAYIGHHWEHRTIRFVRARLALKYAKLLLRSATRRDKALPAPWHVAYRSEIAFLRHYLIERRREHNYPKQPGNPILQALLSCRLSVRANNSQGSR